VGAECRVSYRGGGGRPEIHPLSLIPLKKIVYNYNITIIIRVQKANISTLIFPIPLE